MSYNPVSLTVPQYQADGNTTAAGYYLKGYANGTTTPLSMATDSTGGTLIAKCKLNTAGYPLSTEADDTSVFIPHFNADFKLALYTNATDADADTTTNAIWVVDAIPNSVITDFGATAQTLTDAGAVSVLTSTTFLITTGVVALTLADGVENQQKYIVMKTDGGAATLAPANLANGTNIIFNDIGDSALLLFANATWHWIGGTAFIDADIPRLNFTGADSTPSVDGSSLWRTVGTTTITQFDDGYIGQVVTIVANSVITISASLVNLDGNQDYDMAVGDTLTIVRESASRWREVSRSLVSANPPGAREFGTEQTLTGAGAVNTTSAITHIATTGADALTLANGNTGQVKFLIMTSDGGAGTLTPTSLGNGTTITFDDVGDTATLIYTNSAWYMMAGTATLA